MVDVFSPEFLSSLNISFDISLLYSDNHSDNSTPDNYSSQSTEEEYEKALFIHYLMGIGGTTVCFFGIICNILSVIVLTRRVMNSSTYTYLTALAVCDTIALTLTLLLFLLSPDIQYPEKGEIVWASDAYAYLFPYLHPSAMAMQIIEVGVNNIRYVALEHARPWVIHAYRNIKGRGFHQEEEVKGDEEAVQSGVTVSRDKEDTFTKPHAEDKIEILDKSEVHVAIEAAETPRKRKLADTDDIPANSELGNVQHKESDENEAKKRKLDPVLEDSEVEEVTEIKNQNQTEFGKITIPNDKLNESNTKATDNANIHLESKENCSTPPKDKGNANSTSDNDNDEKKSRSDRKKKSFDDDSAEPVEDHPPRSSYDKVRLIVQPWRKPEGGINKPILKMMLESVMLFLMMNPFSTEKVLHKRYTPYLQPMVLKTIIKILEEIGCIKTKYMKQPKCSLFSKPSMPEFSATETEDHMAMYIPTEECLFRLGQFGREFYPHAKWPQSTVQ